VAAQSIESALPIQAMNKSLLEPAELLRGARNQPNSWALFRRLRDPASRVDQSSSDEAAGRRVLESLL